MVRRYAEGLAERYRLEIAEAFLDRIEAAEKFLCDNNLAGTDSPYLLAGQQVVLKEAVKDYMTASIQFPIANSNITAILPFERVGSQLLK